MSAEPFVITASAASGVTIRPTTDTGMETSSLIFLEYETIKPYGCVPIAGMVSPIFPVWLACATCNVSTPAASNSFAKMQASSSGRPPFPRKPLSPRGVTIGSL